MKFTAKKEQGCAQAGLMCHEFETDDLQKMADYIMAAFAHGDGDLDRRDGDYARLYRDLADFERENFFCGGKLDADEKTRLLASVEDLKIYNNLPCDEQLLFINQSCGWELMPIAGPRCVIDELLNLHWCDLDIEFEE